MLPLNEQQVYGSCGQLLPNAEAKVVDLNTGEALGPGQRGELCVRGPQVRANRILYPSLQRKQVGSFSVHLIM